jgi:Gpi18-like mannosyltransferase
MSNNKAIDLPMMTFVFLSTAALLVVRGALFYFESGDYLLFLKKWVEEYRGMTFLEGLGTKISMYNPPYMYLLNIIARINISDLSLIKITSIIFDFMLAYFVMKIISFKTESINMQILAFFLTLAIPTVILNGAMWGQCDSIYSAFAIGSVYFGLIKRSKACYVFMALAISFKLQAVFLLPMLLVFVITERIKLKDCYFFFIAYIAVLLPAILAGMSLNDALLVYFIQSNYYSALNLNMINMWLFIVHVSYENFRTAGVFLTGFTVLGLTYFTYLNRARLINTVDFVRLAYLFAVIIPFMLPKMHDRYYFMADVLSLVVFLFDKRRWYVPVVTVFCSYLTYAYFMMHGVILLDYRLAAMALLAVIIVVLRDYVISLYSDISVKEQT